MNGKKLSKPVKDCLSVWPCLSASLTPLGTFMSIMNQALRPFIVKCVVVYFDDILVFSSSLDSHLQHLHDVLQVLRQQQLFAACKKCVFGTSQVLFLGYIISAKGLEVDPNKIEAIKSWPVPRTITEVRSFHQVILFAGYLYQEAKTWSELLAYYYYLPSPKAISRCETAV